MRNHLKEINQGYFEHLLGALGYAGTCLIAAFFLLAHGVLPFLWVKKGSALIDRLHQKMRQNHNSH